MALTQIEYGMIAENAITPENLASSGLPSNQTLLNGVFGWMYQDSYYFDLGQITVPADNMVKLLLQTTNIDFKNAGLGYDAGSLV